MAYIVSKQDPRANLRGGSGGMYGMGGVGSYVGGLGGVLKDYNEKANQMRSANAALGPFALPSNIVEAAIVAALGPKPAAAVAAPVVTSPALAAQLLANRTGIPSAGGGSLPINFGAQSTGGGGPSPLLLGGLALGALALVMVMKKGG